MQQMQAKLATYSTTMHITHISWQPANGEAASAATGLALDPAAVWAQAPVVSGQAWDLAWVQALDHLGRPRHEPGEEHLRRQVACPTECTDSVGLILILAFAQLTHSLTLSLQVGCC